MTPGEKMNTKKFIFNGKQFKTFQVSWLNTNARTLDQTQFCCSTIEELLNLWLEFCEENDLDSRHVEITDVSQVYNSYDAAEYGTCYETMEVGNEV